MGAVGNHLGILSHQMSGAVTFLYVRAPAREDTSVRLGVNIQKNEALKAF